MSTFIRQCFVGLKVLVVMTVLLGVAYPAAVWGVGQVAFHGKAERPDHLATTARTSARRSSARTSRSRIPSGSTVGRPRPEYDGLASAASNLGPSNPELLKAIKERQQAIAEAEGVPCSDVPADAVTASGSGLDPYISPEYAALQVKRSRHASAACRSAVRKLVDEHTYGASSDSSASPRSTCWSSTWLSTRGRAAGAH